MKKMAIGAMERNIGLISSRTRMLCEALLERAPQKLLSLEAKQDWSAYGAYIHSLCRSALRLAMLDIRERTDIKSAKKRLRVASEMALKMKCEKPEDIAPCFFDIPVSCCLIHGDLDNAKALARLCIRSLSARQGSYFDAHAKVLSAFVLQDSDLYDRMVEDFRKLPSNYWWSRQSVYFDLYAAVMRRDQDHFARLLMASQNEFERRGADREFGDKMPEYGGILENDLVVDFMALGVSSVALSVGMTIDFDGKYFPLSVLKDR